MLTQIPVEDWSGFFASTEAAVTELTKASNRILAAALADRFAFLNINGVGAPVLEVGSLVLLNGALYSANTEETVSGTAADNAQNYVYLSAETLALYYSTDAPDWNGQKGGWYSGDDRAVLKFFFSNGNYMSKVVLTDQNSMNNVNVSQELPTSGGVLVYQRAVRYKETITLPAGVYRAVCVSGAGGGNGGNGHSGYDQAAPGYGGAPGAMSANTVSGTFYHTGGSIAVQVGGNASYGASGGRGAGGISGYWYTNGGGGAGGNGAGEDSYCGGHVLAPGPQAGYGGYGGDSSNRGSPWLEVGGTGGTGNANFIYDPNVINSVQGAPGGGGAGGYPGWSFDYGSAGGSVSIYRV